MLGCMLTETLKRMNWNYSKLINMSHVNEYDSTFLICITLHNLQKRLLYPLSFYSSQEPSEIG